jgi:predicted HAD superfamily Cof-like phosphohydrolase
MNKTLTQVKEFHETFKAPVLETPQIPSKDRCELRINLMQEELDEIKDCIKSNDLVGILDGLGDLLYVLNGSILEFGLGNIFDEAFDEIQRSNMSKACNSEEEALLTVQFYLDRDGTESHIEKVGDKWMVYRSIDNKVLKCINYSPADLAKILDK